MQKKYIRLIAASAMALEVSAAVVVAAHAQNAKPAATPVRLRGTVQSVLGQTAVLTIVGGTKRVKLTPTSQYAYVVPADRSQIKPGSFLGIASVPQPDGSQRAAEVLIFPEKMRGAGEGSYPWDLPGAGGAAAPHSRMTNGTVAASGSRMTNGTVASKMTNGTVAGSHSRMTNGTVSKQAGGAGVTLTYKGIGGAGSQPIALPPGIPVVTVAPATASDLKAGAHVIVFATPNADGTATAARVMIGKDGLTPPM